MEDVQGGIRHPGLHRDGLSRTGETRSVLDVIGPQGVVAADDEPRELVRHDARREPE